MDPDGAIDAVVSLSGLEDALELRELGGDRQHGLHPRGLGARHHGVAVLGEIGEIEMAVGINQHCWAQYSAERRPGARGALFRG